MYRDRQTAVGLEQKTPERASTEHVSLNSHILICHMSITISCADQEHFSGGGDSDGYFSLPGEGGSDAYFEIFW